MNAGRIAGETPTREDKVPILLKGLDGIRAYVGFSLGKSSWTEIDDELIGEFASCVNGGAASNVESAAHVRGERMLHAQRSLIVSLMISALDELYLLEDTVDGVYYGIDNLRFLAQVPTHASVRATATLARLDAVQGAWQIVLECEMECDAITGSVMSAELLYRFSTLQQARLNTLALCSTS
ncbi:hypothetical protein QZM91_19550 [Burkholderia multivorans]|uniref:hypothetical protein n=1 Tax=Burkholderia multivorans TaxID=87883 RepID=UPI0011B205B6|nr:hypothetical protein [Burkholderia multivorans]MBU9346576.1 hypothetical protein [Burkholderia multivorans]MCO1383870.1 hypothetical protein [Burkholderia multivorans]MCO1400533.1 hypothetical protein [Burkholderia multivorans]MDN7969746.1 hypothetical protein [Burkholderia multivorans]UQO80430.1 hypothetical protein L0Z12_18320 [Burkholderia multivorans]